MSTLAETSRFWFAYLQQDEFLLPRVRVPVRLADMDLDWCGNALRWLERRAASVEMYYTHQELKGLAEPVLVAIGESGGRVIEVRVPDSNMLPTPGSMAADAYDAELDQRVADPVVWLRSTPLCKALAARAEVSGS